MVKQALKLADYTEANIRKWMLEGTTVWWALEGRWQFHHAYKNDVYDKIFPINQKIAFFKVYSRKLSKAELLEIERIEPTKLIQEAKQ